MNEDPVRRAETEALFRDVNERIAVNARRFASGSTEFVCECADPSCTDRVAAALDEYEQVRSNGAHFLLAPGHAHSDLERVVADRGSYHVVEKVDGDVRRVVLQLDPRRTAA